MGHYEVLSSIVMLWMVLSQRGGTDAQTYQWSCSALDINNSRYTLPGFPSTVEELDPPHLLTSGLQMYIYPIPPNPPLNCSGTVSGFGYCYRQRGNSTSAFTLLTMEQAGTSFTITNSIKVRTTTRSQCIGEYCCDSFWLRTDDAFTLPMTDFAFGIVPLLAPLGFNPESVPQYRVGHYRADVQGLTLETGDMVEGGILLTDRTLRLFQFFIDVPPTTASPTTSDDSTTTTATTVPLTTAPPPTAPPPTAPLTTAFSPTAPLTTAPPPTAPPTTAPPTTAPPTTAPPTTSEGNTTTPNTTSPPTTTTEGTDAEEPYQWSCSALDTVKNRYYLPDVPYTLDDAHGFFANISDDLVQSSANTLYIYPLPSSLNCNGTVSELGYCYLVNATQLGTQLSIFRFYVLRESGLVFEVTNSSASILTTPSAENCIASSEGHICCDSFKLRRMNQFRLPASNFTFGIMQSPLASLLAFNQSLYPQYSVQHYREVEPLIPTIKFGFLMEDRALQLFQFFITPDVDATTEPNIATEATEIPDVTSDAEVTATEVTTDGVVTPTEVTTDAEVTTTVITTDAEVTTTEIATDAVITTKEVTTGAEVVTTAITTDAEVTTTEVATDAVVTTTEVTTDAEVTTTEVTTDAEVTTTDVTTDATDATDVATNVAEATSDATEVTPTESMETQLYQWKCSILDQNRNQYFLPGLTEGGDDPDGFIAANPFNFTLPEVQMYIYPLPASLNCNGTVSAVEYCYAYFNTSTRREEELLVFTLLTLEWNERNIRITDSIGIRSTPDQIKCTDFFCCDATRLNLMDQFHLPARNFAFAIAPSSNESAFLLGFNGTFYPQYLVRHYTRSLFEGSQFNVTPSDEALRVFQFIITPVTDQRSTTAADVATTVTEDSRTTQTTRRPTTGQVNTRGSTSNIDGRTTEAQGAVGGSGGATIAVAGGVVGGIVVATLVLVVVLALVIIMRRKRRESWKPPAGGDISYPNAIYGEDEPYNVLQRPSAGIPQKDHGPNTYSHLQEPATILPNDAYEEIPQDQANEYSYAQFGEKGLKINTTYEAIPPSREKQSETYETIPSSRTPVEKKSEPRKELTPPPALAERDSESYEDVTPPFALAEDQTKTKTAIPPYATVNKKPKTPEYAKVDKKRSKEPSTPEPEKIYQMPETDENALYAQLGEIFTNSVTRDTVSLGDLMGSGQFGTVYRGVWQSDIRGEVKVAVKTLKEGSKEEDRVKFLQEAAIMGQFKHHNVVEMYGVVSVGEPVLLVLEMLSKGDLRGHLLRLRSNEEGNVNTDDHTLLKYCQDIAAGLAYLSGKAFVHRDLAARNVLVSEDDTCKIADFGMSRDLMDESYYVSHGGKIPVKWTAPEALNYKKYSTASDVWSYGIVMYEIWSVGHKPFEDFGNNKVLKLVETGYRLPPPPGCPRAIYNVMVSCWHPKTSMRPDFAAICHQLSPADAELLKWTEADKSTHPQVVVLGADLIHSKELFKDLQTMYITNGNM